MAAAIVAHPGDPETALASYEAAMFPHAVAASIDAHSILSLWLDDRSPAGLLDFFAGAFAGGGDASALPTHPPFPGNTA